MPSPAAQSSGPPKQTGCPQLESYLTIAGVSGGTLNSTDQATLNVNGCVTLQLVVVRDPGGPQNVSNDGNTHYFTDPPRGQFAGNVFCATAAECNKAFPLYASYFDSCTRTTHGDTAHVTVRPCP